jgi:hypothetical protein
MTTAATAAMKSSLDLFLAKSNAFANVLTNSSSLSRFFITFFMIFSCGDFLPHSSSFGQPIEGSNQNIGHNKKPNTYLKI